MFRRNFAFDSEYLSFGVLLLVSFSLHAQDVPPLADGPKAWKFSATLDSVYSDNLTHPADGRNLLRNFDSMSNSPSLSAATLSAQYASEHFGVHLDTGYGEMYHTIGSADPWRGPNQYVGQLYVSYKPLVTSNLQLDFGKFYTTAGAEVPEVLSNYNYSRSLLFVLALPYDHFGLRATVPITRSLTATVGLVNGWNNVIDNNSGKTLMLAASLTKPKWGVVQTYIGGPEKSQTNQGFRHLSDTVFTAAPKTWIEGYMELAYGMEHRLHVPAVPDSGRDHWGGGAVAVRFKFPKNLSMSPRFEYLSDATGFATGVHQHLTEWTTTGGYQPRAFMTWRLEYRADRSNVRFFSSRKNQQTALLAVIFKVGGER